MDDVGKQIALSRSEVTRIERFRRLKDTAILTIMFTDIVGYTKFTETAGESVSAEFRREHDRLFIETVSRDGAGEIVKQIGDSFLAVFSEPSTAVIRALEFQRALDERSAEFTHGNYTLKVRIGIHLGQIAVENTLQPDIFGKHVNRASRIESIANPGQVLTSNSVWENASGWISSQTDLDIRLIQHGKTRLKGVQEAVDVYEAYYSDIGTAGVPVPVKKYRRKRVRVYVALGASLALLIAVASYITYERAYRASIASLDSTYLADVISDEYGLMMLDSLLAARSSYGFGENSRVLSPIPDSALRQVCDLVHSAFSAYSYPNIVVGESEFVDQYAFAGRPAPAARSVQTLPSTADVQRFLASESFSRALYTRVYRLSPPLDGKRYMVWFKLYSSYHPDCLGVSSWFPSNYSDIPSELYNRMSMMEKDIRYQTEIVGEVISVDNDRISVRLEADAHVVNGVRLYLRKIYHGEDGRRQRLKDIECVISCLSDHYEIEEANEWLSEVYDYYILLNYGYTVTTADNENELSVLAGLNFAIQETRHDISVAVITEDVYDCLSPSVGDQVLRQTMFVE